MDQTPELHPLKHGALFYNTPDERLQLLAEFFRSGLENEELCILITPSTTDEVVQDLQTVGLNLQPYIKYGWLRVFNMLDTYISEGHFVSNYITNNLVSYVDDAKESGYKGIRMAGDMNWLHDYPDAHDEAVCYETGINDLSVGYPTFILCLFSMRDMTASLAKNILARHPFFVYDGKQHDNPYYELPGASPTTYTGTQAKKTSSSRAKETAAARQAIKKLLTSLNKVTDKSGTPYK
ncbi:MAG: hypothetical protein JWO35_843 [Candidatus Saccharibacteria bacterium]|nr:hypothetical protein [Candidatus Saccharibacteria bacterium]